MEFTFYISAVIALLSCLRVITSTKPIYALLYLIIMLLALSAIFFSLGAYFAAALEIIIYAGAIMVLFVFVVMMLNIGNQVSEQEKKWLQPKAWLGPAILALALFAVLVVGILADTQGGLNGDIIDAKQVGIALFGPYFIMVELASMLLLAGIVVAYHIGRENKAAQEQIMTEQLAIAEQADVEEKQ